MKFKVKSLLNNFFLIFFCNYSSLVFAHAYEAPKSPELYADKASLEPKNTYVKTGVYIGPSASIGKNIFSGDSHGDSIVAYGYGLEFGYKKANKNWNFWKMGVGVQRGKFGYSKATVESEWEITPRFGYGSRLGDDIYGFINMGPTLFSAKYEGKDKKYDSISSKDSQLGFGFFLGYDLNLIVTNRIILTFGGRWMYRGIAFKDAVVKSNSKEVSLNKDISVNSIDMKLMATYTI